MTEIRLSNVIGWKRFAYLCNCCGYWQQPHEPKSQDTCGIIVLQESFVSPTSPTQSQNRKRMLLVHHFPIVLKHAPCHKSINGQLHGSFHSKSTTAKLLNRRSPIYAANTGYICCAKISSGKNLNSLRRQLLKCDFPQNVRNFLSR